jgi:hypothetical protein
METIEFANDTMEKEDLKSLLKEVEAFESLKKKKRKKS